MFRSTGVPRGRPLCHGPPQTLKMKNCKAKPSSFGKTKAGFCEYSWFALDFEAYANAFLVFEKLPI